MHVFMSDYARATVRLVVTHFTIACLCGRIEKTMKVVCRGDAWCMNIKLSRNTHEKITIITEKSHSYNHIISLHCTHRSTIRYDKTYEIRRSVQIPIRHICTKSYTIPTATEYVINALTY